MYGFERKVRDILERYLLSPADMDACKLGRRTSPSVRWASACVEFFCRISKFLSDALIRRKGKRKRKALSRPTKQRTQTG